jgi:uncharacterized protein (DUF2147 family)
MSIALTQRLAVIRPWRLAAAALFTTLAVLCLPHAALANSGGSSITGIWHTGQEDGTVEIYRCGAAYCGKIADAATLRRDPNLRDIHNREPQLRDRRLRGLVVLHNFAGGPTQFKGGPLYDPATGDKATRGELKLLPTGKLEVKGCVSIFCRTKIWTRVN